MELLLSFIHSFLGFYTCEVPTEAVRRCMDAMVRQGHTCDTSARRLPARAEVN
jgi:hypothetical protein